MDNKDEDGGGEELDWIVRVGGFLLNWPVGIFAKPQRAKDEAGQKEEPEKPRKVWSGRKSLSVPKI